MAWKNETPQAYGTTTCMHMRSERMNTMELWVDNWDQVYYLLILFIIYKGLSLCNVIMPDASIDSQHHCRGSHFLVKVLCNLWFFYKDIGTRIAQIFMLSMTKGQAMLWEVMTMVKCGFSNDVDKLLILPQMITLKVYVATPTWYMDHLCMVSGFPTPC